MHQVRVLVIDDSAFMRKMITEILSADERIKVIDTARNGKIGLAKIQKLQPDVVTLDIEMPIMDGMTTLREIMQTSPLPVVMLSSMTGLGASKTVEAISNGAVDFITKPSGPISLDIETIKRELISKVLAAAKVKQECLETREVSKTISSETKLSLDYPKTIIAIGTSTGGPRALQRVLADIPEGQDIPPILIVQHMPEKFTKSLADRLNTLTTLEVKEAVHGEIIRNNSAYIAPGNHHMHVRSVGTSHAIELSKETPRNGHRPSVDTLFESVAQLKRVNKLAIVLTGMGSDGADGIAYLKAEDPQSIIVAESADSAVIYGMPKAAIKTGSVNSIIHLHQIGAFIGKINKIPGEM